MKDAVLRGIFLSFVRVHVLHHAVEGEIYGVEMIEELARHGYSLGPGTVYPLLHSMEKFGFLVCERRVVEGKVRKYYHATEEGRLALKELREKIKELIDEVL
jgi:PadR family transcriptional regulator PadR